MTPRPSIFAFLLLAGCWGNSVDNRTVDPTQQRLIALVRAYGRAAAATEKAPKSFADLAIYLGDTDTKSPRDGKPFVVLWGTKFIEREPSIYIYEAEGQDGRRYVALTDGSTREVAEDEFQKLPKAK